MTLTKFSWLASACALLAALSATPASAAVPRVELVEARSDTHPRITVRVNTSDDEGRPLEGLHPEVQVFESGQPQPSAEFRSVRNRATPTNVVLAIDVSGSMAEDGKLAQAQSAAKSFLNQMRARDRIGLVSFAGSLAVKQQLTSDRRPLTRAIDAFVADGNTRLHDGLNVSLAQLSGIPRGARAVVLLTDGRDSGSERSIADVTTQAANAGIPVYTIGLGGDVDSDVLGQIASASGGRYYVSPTGDELTHVFKLISRQLTSEYELTWLSTSPRGGDEVPVQIRVRLPDGSDAQLSFMYATPQLDVPVVPRSVVPVTPGGGGAVISPPALPDATLANQAGWLAAAAVGALLLGLMWGRVNRRLEARLSIFVAGKPKSARGADDRGLSARRAGLNPITSFAARFAARLVPRRQMQVLRRKLGQAGHGSERHLALFLATEVALALVFGMAAYSLLQMRGLGERAPLLPVLIAVGLGILGLYMPYMWLRRRVEWRQRALIGALPDALDLMAIAVSAGLSLDSAMQEVAEKWDGELSRELGQVLNEMQLGASRREALQNLVERTQLDDFRLLVAALIQADELGANLSETLSVQAVQLRIRRRQLAEEKARKAPVKMLIPLVLFIFPAMFVVLLAPAVIQFMSAMRGMARG